MTVPRRSIANRHSICRLRMCAYRKLHSSKLFERSGPSYTLYHMMAETRPLYLLNHVMNAPLRLQWRYHADPLLTDTSIVVYACVPIANYTAASCLNYRGLPTHHTIWWRRVDLHHTSCFALSGHFFDYSDGTKPIACCVVRQSLASVCQMLLTCIFILLLYVRYKLHFPPYIEY